MPDAKRDSALLFMSSKPLTCDIPGSLPKHDSTFCINLAMLAKLCQLWPLTLRTGIERILIVKILSVQVENRKSRPPDNASFGCGIWQRLPSLLVFFLVLSPAFFQFFQPKASEEESTKNKEWINYCNRYLGLLPYFKALMSKYIKRVLVNSKFQLEVIICQTKNFCTFINFCIDLGAAGEWLCEVWWWLWRHFYVQNVIELRFSWNKCFMIYPTNAEKNDAACRNTSQVIKLKIHLFQHLLVFQSWYNVTTDATWKLCRATKIVLLLGVSTCRATSFECLRHIRLNLRQSTTYPSMTSKSYSSSYFEHSSNWYFSIIHSLWRFIIKKFRFEVSVFIWSFKWKCHATSMKVPCNFPTNLQNLSLGITASLMMSGTQKGLSDLREKVSR